MDKFESLLTEKGIYGKVKVDISDLPDIENICRVVLIRVTSLIVIALLVKHHGLLNFSIAKYIRGLEW